MTACSKERKLPYEGGQFRTFLLGRELPVLSVSGHYPSGRSCLFPQHWMQEIRAASLAFGLPPGKACSFSCLWALHRVHDRTAFPAELTKDFLRFLSFEVFTLRTLKF